MNQKVDKTAIASELIIEAAEMKGKRPTQLNFQELIDVVESIVKKLTIPDVSSSCEWCGAKKENHNGLCTECGRFPSPSNFR